MAAMTYSKTGQDFTSSFERCKRVAYRDSGGVWTIGWGHTRGVTEGLTCIQAQADTWRAEDMGYSEAEVNHLVSVPLNQGQFDALVDFTFNVGVGNFAKSTLLRLLNQGDFAGAAQEFDKWDYCKGKLLDGLFIRREGEKREFEGV